MPGGDTAGGDVAAPEANGEGLAAGAATGPAAVAGSGRGAAGGAGCGGTDVAARGGAAAESTAVDMTRPSACHRDVHMV